MLAVRGIFQSIRYITVEGAGYKAIKESGLSVTYQNK